MAVGRAFLSVRADPELRATAPRINTSAQRRRVSRPPDGPFTIPCNLRRRIADYPRTPRGADGSGEQSRLGKALVRDRSDEITGAAFIEGALDLEAQTQSNGVELTLDVVESFAGGGALAFDNAERELPPTERLDYDGDGWLALPPGAYKVRYTETVTVPLDRFALARPRSSLLRMGASMPTALWDSGFRGKSEGLLVVHNPHGLRLHRGARLIQLVFFRTDAPSAKPYNGAYQNTGL